MEPLLGPLSPNDGRDQLDALGSVVPTGVPVGEWTIHATRAEVVVAAAVASVIGR